MKDETRFFCDQRPFLAVLRDLPGMQTDAHGKITGIADLFEKYGADLQPGHRLEVINAIDETVKRMEHANKSTRTARDALVKWRNILWERHNADLPKPPGAQTGWVMVARA